MVELKYFTVERNLTKKNIKCRSNRLMMVAAWHDPQSAVVLLTPRLAPHDEQMA